MGEDAESLQNDHLEKRNFHLALSITNGQELAHIAGFAIPSEEVQRQEIMDMISKWLMIHTTGILDEVNRCADWIVETTAKVNNFTDEQQEASRIFVTSFALATIIHLLDMNCIDYVASASDTDEKSREFIKKNLLGGF